MWIGSLCGSHFFLLLFLQEKLFDVNKEMHLKRTGRSTYGAYTQEGLKRVSINSKYLFLKSKDSCVFRKLRTIKLP